MTYNPKIFIQVSFILTGVVTFFCYKVDPELAKGVLLSSFLLTLNLIGWVWVIKTFVELINEGASSLLFTLFNLIKFVVLATSLLLVFAFFGPAAILISNTVVVASLLFPALYFVLNQSKGLSNEC
jgi:hypothetical protein